MAVAADRFIDQYHLYRPLDNISVNANITGRGRIRTHFTPAWCEDVPHVQHCKKSFRTQATECLVPEAPLKRAIDVPGSRFEQRGFRTAREEKHASSSCSCFAIAPLPHIGISLATGHNRDRTAENSVEPTSRCSSAQLYLHPSIDLCLRPHIHPI